MCERSFENVTKVPGKRQCRTCFNRKVADADRKKRYGITPERYNEMWAEQQGLCAICGLESSTPTIKGAEYRSLAVDHCHTTGMIRRLLCTNCNTALGNLKDDIALVEAALRYLREFEEVANCR